MTNLTYTSNQKPYLYSTVSLSSVVKSLKEYQNAGIFTVWILTIVTSIGFGIANIEYHWSGLQVNLFGQATYITIYPTLIICTLWTLWFGLLWGIIPAYISTFIVALYSGMPLGWSSLFAFADPLMLTMIALAYAAIPQSLDLRSVRSGLFFVLITFVAAISGSSGSFIWTHTNATYIGDDFSIWQGWWMGGFLQAILINGPILYVFTRPMSAWKKLNLQVSTWKIPDTRYIGVFYLGLSLSISLFIIVANHFSLQGKSSNYDDFGYAELYYFVQSAIQSSDTTTWIIIVLVVFTAYLGYQVTVNWTRFFKDSAEKQAHLLKKLEQSNLELKRVNAELKASKADLLELNESKDRFLSIISHDLKSPFSSLLGLSGYLNSDFEKFEESKKKEFIQAINRSAKQLFNLLHNLLQWANIHQGRMVFQPIELKVSELIDQNIEIYKETAKKKNISINVKMEEDVYAFADQQMIDTSIRNIISNAIKFTREEGKVYVRLKKEEDKVNIEVTDTGVGIAEKDKSRLFKIDSKITSVGTNNERGSGLGLILCKDFIETNGGELQVVSKKEEGTTVTINLPLFVGQLSPEVSGNLV